MTLADRIREVLRAASGPMTAREVREELDDESATPENVGSTLSYMCKTGEVMRDAPSTSGSATYLIDPSYVPKRAPKQDIAENVAKNIARNIAKVGKAAGAKRGRSASNNDKAPPSARKSPAPNARSQDRHGAYSERRQIRHVGGDNARGRFRRRRHGSHRPWTVARPRPRGHGAASRSDAGWPQVNRAHRGRSHALTCSS